MSFGCYEDMKILLTGATGYIGKRILPLLLEAGHEVVCCVRDRARFRVPTNAGAKVYVVEVDFLEDTSAVQLPFQVDAAFYLIHSMSSSTGDFQEMEARSARHFLTLLRSSGARQIVYLSGIVNSEVLSRHLTSRFEVEQVLSSGDIPLTTLRAGIIIGSGSASFEIMRDLVEKLPVMIAPRWLETRSQPIAVRNVLDFLIGVLDRSSTFGQSFDIGGHEVLTYRQMLLRFARLRGLKRYIWTVPVMTPRLSSYWLYFVTATSYPLAVHLVNSMKVEVICRSNDLAQRLGIRLLGFDEAIERAFSRIEQNEIVSSWKDALSSGQLKGAISDYIQVPVHGCFRDARQAEITDEKAVLDRIWALGGDNGWYYGNFLWRLRGFLDKLIGGVGLRRGRTHPTDIQAGDALDFWRVLLADKAGCRLLLYAEMRLPGEAWLEFSVTDGVLHQTATFRPRGVLGRLYWYVVTPLHLVMFEGMLRRLAHSRI
jgi:uncharacterized protein YbjT (DUF2867 family)